MKTNHQVHDVISCPFCGGNSDGLRLFYCHECGTLSCELCGLAKSMNDFSFCPNCNAVRPVDRVLVQPDARL